MTITAPTVAALPEPALLIGGRRVTEASGGRHPHIYPGTGELTTTVPLAGAAEIDAAVTAARDALPGWRAMSVQQRRDIMIGYAGLLREHADALAALHVIDTGIPAAFATFMPNAAAEIAMHNAGWIERVGGEVISGGPSAGLNYTLGEPYGVVGIIIPWNGPLYSTARVALPALAAGNCVVVKPPELSPFTTQRMGELALEAGFPPGVVNVVTGSGEAGGALVGHPGVDKIHFTGSAATAKRILTTAARTRKPVGLELGGKSALLVFADADLDAAVPEALSGIVNLSGQGCVNGTRILVERSIYDDFVSMVATAAGQIPVGDPYLPGTLMGPVISKPAEQRILGVIATAKDEKARLVAGGEKLGGPLESGYYVAPTVFADVDGHSDLARNEVFGPVLAMMPFDDEADALRQANDTTYGLAAYVRTSDLARAHRVAAALEVGNVWVNGWLGSHPGASFGGNKQSGYGRLGGVYGIREFIQTKNILDHHVSSCYERARAHPERVALIDPD